MIYETQPLATVPDPWGSDQPHLLREGKDRGQTSVWLFRPNEFSPCWSIPLQRFGGRRYAIQLDAMRTVAIDLEEASPTWTRISAGEMAAEQQRAALSLRPRREPVRSAPV